MPFPSKDWFRRRQRELDEGRPLPPHFALRDRFSIPSDSTDLPDSQDNVSERSSTTIADAEIEITDEEEPGQDTDDANSVASTAGLSVKACVSEPYDYLFTPHEMRIIMALKNNSVFDESLELESMGDENIETLIDFIKNTMDLMKTPEMGPDEVFDVQVNRHGMRVVLAALAQAIVAKDAAEGAKLPTQPAQASTSIAATPEPAEKDTRGKKRGYDDMSMSSSARRFAVPSESSQKKLSPTSILASHPNARSFCEASVGNYKWGFDTLLEIGEAVRTGDNVWRALHKLDVSTTSAKKCLHDMEMDYDAMPDHTKALVPRAWFEQEQGTEVLRKRRKYGEVRFGKPTTEEPALPDGTSKRPFPGRAQRGFDLNRAIDSDRTMGEKSQRKPPGYSHDVLRDRD
ncbi:hypothetical protein B0H63DRAFT_523843 [Podospora didyma]|uniref:Uncharacterized protein n=1 Tax=Podospora didyma TaxID=330526 RepID=A0AAE0NGL8_9PEZI|nr:hypothetical protein B0H63DRAFT_523843 [Podospora didyma]